MHLLSIFLLSSNGPIFLSKFLSSGLHSYQGGLVLQCAPSPSAVLHPVLFRGFHAGIHSTLNVKVCSWVMVPLLFFIQTSAQHHCHYQEASHRSDAFLLYAIHTQAHMTQDPLIICGWYPYLFLIALVNTNRF